MEVSAAQVELAAVAPVQRAAAEAVVRASVHQHRCLVVSLLLLVVARVEVEATATEVPAAVTAVAAAVALVEAPLVAEAALRGAGVQFMAPVMVQQPVVTTPAAPEAQPPLVVLAAVAEEEEVAVCLAEAVPFLVEAYPVMVVAVEVARMVR